MSAFASLLVGLSAAFLDTSSLVASEVLRAGDVITEANTELDALGDSKNAEALFGREVRRTVYAGQKIVPANTRSRRVIKRNQIVTVKYHIGALEIAMNGRALGEAGVGETVEIMNTQSRKVITGTVTKEGWVNTQ
ncbi:MAG: hypothetical protein Hens3KO_21180 [Henriciella sp.]